MARYASVCNKALGTTTGVEQSMVNLPTNLLLLVHYSYANLDRLHYIFLMRVMVSMRKC